ncbi:MAG: GGDEF domain-containing protein [Alphaproteobacteria bacterium]|nr:GGDEF domain-containing protein [Alphaproteobacteria bacterium]
MILRVLIINECGLDLSRIKKYLEDNFSKVTESRSMEDALRAVGRSHLDLVLLALSDAKSICSDFLSVLRLTLGVTPLIGIADNCSPRDFPLFSNRGVDDIVYSDISGSDLFRKVHALSEAKEKIYSSFLVKDALRKPKNKKITVFSENRLDLFDADFLDKGTVVNFVKNSNLTNYPLSDIFLIDAKLKNIEQLCINLKLCKAYRYKPILLITDEIHRKKALSVCRKNIGALDIIDLGTHPSIISCMVDAHIKYKRLLDGFYHEVKRNIYMSSVDAITSVYNRSFLEDYISRRDEALNHSAVLMIDLDKFKEINDRYGHTFADKVLGEVVAHIKSYIRLTDFIARYGGDEFLIFMRNISREEIEKIALRLVNSVENKLFNGIRCTISIGACYIGSENVKLREAIFIADSFMYISKRSGGNSVYLC